MLKHSFVLVLLVMAYGCFIWLKERVLASMVACYGCFSEWCDVKTTFLHDEVGEKIYMNWLEDFIVYGKEDLMCLLKNRFMD